MPARTTIQPGFPEPLEELRHLSSEEIISRHDKVVQKLNGAAPGMRASYWEQAQRYLSVLQWQETKRQANKMEDLTENINRLTWAVVILTALTLCLVALTLWHTW
jgi:hypothetical protein